VLVLAVRLVKPAVQLLQAVAHKLPHVRRTLILTELLQQHGALQHLAVVAGVAAKKALVDIAKKSRPAWTPKIAMKTLPMCKN
jgi:hypothetical protein